MAAVHDFEVQTPLCAQAFAQDTRENELSATFEADGLLSAEKFVFWAGARPWVPQYLRRCVPTLW
jgi:hypothetical protein